MNDHWAINGLIYLGYMGSAGTRAEDCVGLVRRQHELLADRFLASTVIRFEPTLQLMNPH